MSYRRNPSRKLRGTRGTTLTHLLRAAGAATLALTLVGCSTALGPIHLGASNGTPPDQYQTIVNGVSDHVSSDSAAITKSCFDKPDTIFSTACMSALQKAARNTTGYSRTLHAHPAPDCLATGGAALMRALDGYSAEDDQLLAAVRERDPEAFDASVQAKRVTTAQLSSAIDQLRSESPGC